MEKDYLKQIGELIWKSNPEVGVIIFALAVLALIYIIFYKK
jgi:hypothetical protein